MRTTLVKGCVVAAVACTPLALATAPAEAAHSPSSGTGLIGGCNMVNDPTMFTVAMEKLSQQGWDGMFTAAAASGDPYCTKSLGG